MAVYLQSFVILHSDITLWLYLTNKSLNKENKGLYNLNKLHFNIFPTTRGLRNLMNVIKT